MLTSYLVKSLEKNAMGFVVTLFVSLVMAVAGAIFSGPAEAKTVTRNGAVYSCEYECSNQSNSQLVKTNETCRGCNGNQSCLPGFKCPPASDAPQVIPAAGMPLPSIVQDDSSVKNGLAGIAGLIFGIISCVGGGFAGYRQEKAKDELIAEAEAAKEKAFVESHSAKLAAAKLASASK